jgi:hypothetical protein
MTRERAKSMDQRSFWMVDAAGAPRKLRRPPMASPEPSRMLAFAPFQGFIRGNVTIGQATTKRNGPRVDQDVLLGSAADARRCHSRRAPSGEISR